MVFHYVSCEVDEEEEVEEEEEVDEVVLEMVQSGSNGADAVIRRWWKRWWKRCS